MRRSSRRLALALAAIAPLAASVPAAGQLGSVAAPPTATAAEAPRPVLGQTVVLEAIQGEVLATPPGAAAATLTGARSLPLGTVVDASAGIVAVTSAADGAGRTQSARVSLGEFRLAQSPKRGSFTRAVLLGSMSRCRLRVADGPAASGRIGGPRRFGRRLQVEGRGRFRLVGVRAAAAAARKAAWKLTDTCEATTKVRSTKGRVAVTDFARKRKLALPPGQSYVAPGPKSPRG